MFAVIFLGGKQYKVKEGDILSVAKLEGKPGESVTIKDVLLVGNDKETKIGAPYVRGAKVTATILAQEKGDKIEIRRFKAKVRYRRKRGFRPEVSKVQITSIG